MSALAHRLRGLASRASTAPVRGPCAASLPLHGSRCRENTAIDAGPDLAQARVVESSEPSSSRAHDSLQRRCAELEQQNRTLQRAVARQKVALRHAQEELEALTTLVGNELRAPLFNITGFTAELSHLRDQVLQHWRSGAPDAAEYTRITAELDEAFGYVNGAAAKMGTLLEGALSVLRAGRNPLTFDTVDTQALVRDVMVPLRDRLRGREGTVLVASLPTWISDDSMLREVFHGLLHNAVTNLRDDAPYHVEVNADESADAVEFHVHDNGRGIAPSEIPGIFHLSRVRGGRGLARVRALVRCLGGVMRVRSELGAGTTVSFELPRPAAAVDALTA